MHTPVLEKEILEFLDPKNNQNFVDCTVNGGGHTKKILEKTKGKVLGIEADPEIYEKLKAEKIKRLVLVNDNFVNLKEILEKEKFNSVSGILFDLGFSSWHVDQSGKGFSFSRNEFLDMRYSAKEENITAWEIINRWPEENIRLIFKEYGEERFSRIIAERIVEKRKEKTIDTTFDLVEIIEASIPARFKKQKNHLATRCFQGLRIQVNDELENLKRVLPQAIDCLDRKARIALISFHSLEDRIVKHFLKQMAQENRVRILTKKPIIASEEEIINNPRSRSAKLRVAEII
jgi:16S rRNA (cytosine1402-N4)-methyltransferase